MIALASDHTGIEMKKEIMKLLDEMGLEWKDFGTNEPVSCDYPIYGYRAAKAVAVTPWTTYSLPSSLVNGIFQARIPEWFAISFSRG